WRRKEPRRFLTTELPDVPVTIPAARPNPRRPHETRPFRRRPQPARVASEMAASLSRPLLVPCPSLSGPPSLPRLAPAPNSRPGSSHRHRGTWQDAGLMEVEIRASPSFAVGRCTLGPGEQMKAEAGAMMAHSVGVELEAKVQGGLMKGLKRSI